MYLTLAFVPLITINTIIVAAAAAIIIQSNVSSRLFTQSTRRRRRLLTDDCRVPRVLYQRRLAECSSLSRVRPSQTQCVCIRLCIFCLSQARARARNAAFIFLCQLNEIGRATISLCSRCISSFDVCVCLWCASCLSKCRCYHNINLITTGGPCTKQTNEATKQKASEHTEGKNAE